MAIMRPPKGMRPATTKGWDVVSAVRIGTANEAIAMAGTSPARLSAEAGLGMAAEGRFGDWAIWPGGDCHLFHLTMPLRDEEVTRVGFIETLP